jgi:5-formyltetrahydrofolate cyclo-ligase
VSIEGDNGKQERRSAGRRARRALQATSPKAGEQAAAHFPADRLKNYSVAAIYWPCSSEIDPRPLGRRLEQAGARLCLPTVHTIDRALEFRAFRWDGHSRARRSGARAPAASAAIVRPDLVIVPLLAYDASGGRLGQGGGYYDRTISQLREGGPVFVLGLAYAGQEVERLPAETHDQPLDAVLTETGLRLFATRDD